MPHPSRWFAIFFSTVMLGSGALAVPLGTGFTYQGRLEIAGVPVNGTANLRFSLWEHSAGGARVGVFHRIANVSVANGLFVVSVNSGNQFGAGAFNGDVRWLQTEVCNDANCTTTTILSPRQQLTGAPYSLGPWNTTAAGDLSYTGGYVGIGTATPTADLHIDSNTDDGTFIRMDSGLTGPERATIIFSDRGSPIWTMGKRKSDDFDITGLGSGGVFRMTKDGDFLLSNNSGRKITLNSNVEIGTSSGDTQSLRLGGGAASGRLYSSPNQSNTINLGYNYYQDTNGNNQFDLPATGSSRIALGNSILLLVGDAGVIPATGLSIFASGEVQIGDGEYVPRAQVSTRIISGQAGPAGKLAGNGFNVVKTSPNYVIVFDKPFSELPAVTATVMSSGGATIIEAADISSASTTISLYDRANGSPASGNFSFIAIGRI